VDVSLRYNQYMLEPDVWIGEVMLFGNEYKQKYNDEIKQARVNNPHGDSYASIYFIVLRRI